MNFKTTSLMAVIIFTALLLSSCEDKDLKPLTSEEIGFTAVVGNLSSGNFNVHGERQVGYSLNSKKGTVGAVKVFFKDQEIHSSIGETGSFHLVPDSSPGEAKLELRAVVSHENKNYTESAVFKVRNFPLSEDDFEVIDCTIDRFVVKMKGERLENYKYYLSEREIEDLDNIVFLRNELKYQFPRERDVAIKLVPGEHTYASNWNYPFVKFTLKDKMIGDFPATSSIFHYIDDMRQELYIWNASKLSVLDKDMNELHANAGLDPISKIIASPNSVVVVLPHLAKLKVYPDNKLDKVAIEISPRTRIDNLRTNDKDQLFNAHNHDIDVYDLRTGEMIYTIEHSPTFDFAISRDKLLAGISSNDDPVIHVYQLNESSASLLYELNKKTTRIHNHPFNKDHFIFDSMYEGFEVFDVETRTTVFSTKGEFQNVDPVTGNLLYYDEEYGKNNRNYTNRVVDSKYEEVFTFEDVSKSEGPFKILNNRLVKSDKYTNLLPK